MVRLNPESSERALHANYIRKYVHMFAAVHGCIEEDGQLRAVEREFANDPPDINWPWDFAGRDFGGGSTHKRNTR